MVGEQCNAFMIYLLITTHPSRRFPGKNDILARYTLDWAAAAALYCEEEVKIVHVGPEWPVWLPVKVQHVPTARDSGSHLADVLQAEEVLSPALGDVLVLAQLTNPLRRVSLLREVVQEVRRTGRSVITAAVQPSFEWRRTDDAGRWGDKTTACTELHHDGSLYAWSAGRTHDIFDRSFPHSVVKTGCRWALVDVDLRGDLPETLPTLWAHSLHGDI